MIIKGWFHQILQRKCFISLWMMDPRPPDFHVMGAWKKNRVLERRDEKAPERSRPTLDLMIGCVDSSAAPWATAARGVPGRRLRPPLPAALGDFYLKKKRQTSFFRRLLLLRVPSSNHKSQRDGVRGPLPPPPAPPIPPKGKPPSQRSLNGLGQLMCFAAGAPAKIRVFPRAFADQEAGEEEQDEEQERTPVDGWLVATGLPRYGFYWISLGFDWVVSLGSFTVLSNITGLASFRGLQNFIELVWVFIGNWASTFNGLLMAANGYKSHGCPIQPVENGCQKKF